MATLSIDPRVSSRTTDFVGSDHKMLIDGRFVKAASGKTFPVYNPATGDVIAHVPEGETEDVNRAVMAARRAFDDGPWPRMSPSERGRLLWRVADLVEQHLDEFAELESLDNGKPYSVARVADVPLTVDMFRYMGGWATKISGKTLPLSAGHDFHSYTLREPIGVVAQIIPWNFPLLMAAWKLAPALACGCTIVLKLAEQTPLTGLRLAQVLDEAGLPAGVVNVITGYGEGAGAPLAAHDMVDKVAFTGSTEVGKLIVKAAAGNLKKVTLELGGKSPAIVFPDAKIDHAIEGTASAIFFNHGQCCCAGSRLYVHEKVFDEVVEGVSNVANGIKLAPGMDPSCQMGPLVSDEQYHKVVGYIESGIQEGAKVAAGGPVSGVDRGWFVRPTVLTNTNPRMKVVQEEIFGPVVCAVPFSDRDIDAIIRRANDTVYG
ncbi:MAG: aldehyde dehydrogenase family protein, partial [Terracidiphilus sp.]